VGGRGMPLGASGSRGAQIAHTPQKAERCKRSGLTINVLGLRAGRDFFVLRDIHDHCVPALILPDHHGRSAGAMALRYRERVESAASWP
jgi:hypothetical protein